MYSEKYEEVKRKYFEGEWNVDDVRTAVMLGWITDKEYQFIIGAEYE